MTTPLRYLTLALLTSSAFGLTDCKKNSEPAPDKRSQQEIWLTASGWNIQSFVQVETTPGGVVTTLNFPLSYFPACSLDDLVHFNANRTLTVDEGPLQCQPAAPSTTWEFAANETEIVFGNSTKHAKIVTLTATTLALATADTLFNGTKAVVTQTFVAR